MTSSTLSYVRSLPSSFCRHRCRKGENRIPWFAASHVIAQYALRVLQINRTKQNKEKESVTKSCSHCLDRVGDKSQKCSIAFHLRLRRSEQHSDNNQRRRRRKKKKTQKKEERKNPRTSSRLRRKHLAHLKTRCGMNRMACCAGNGNCGTAHSTLSASLLQRQERAMKAHMLAMAHKLRM